MCIQSCHVCMSGMIYISFAEMATYKNNARNKTKKRNTEEKKN